MDVRLCAERFASQISKTILFEYNNAYPILKSCFSDPETYKEYKRLDAADGTVIRETNRILLERCIPFLVIMNINKYGYRTLDVVGYAP